MMSFGATLTDKYGKTSPFPGKSLLTGLLGNALGYDHRDTQALGRLQSRIHHAVRRDRGGQIMTDFQSVDLDQPHLSNQVAWTAEGRLNPRGGNPDETIHLRYRDYLVDSVFTIALTLHPAEEEPTLETLEEALRHPARPLFLGRKCCVPSLPILLEQEHRTGIVSAENLRAAVIAAPRLPREESPLLWWPRGDNETPGWELFITDERDWANQMHTGTNVMVEGKP